MHPQGVAAQPSLGFYPCSHFSSLRRVKGWDQVGLQTGGHILPRCPSSRGCFGDRGVGRWFGGVGQSPCHVGGAVSGIPRPALAATGHGGIFMNGAGGSGGRR